MLDREDRIIDINIEDEMKTAYIDYSMSVIVSRALPDVRDGFKPVHRRVLYAMNEDGNTYDKPTRKCASAVGQVMKYYHPHGDSSIYGTLVRLAQPWNLRYHLAGQTVQARLGVTHRSGRVPVDRQGYGRLPE